MRENLRRIRGLLRKQVAGCHYGPEMRGGTANCSVIISDSPVRPQFQPDVLIAMNLPSLTATSAGSGRTMFVARWLKRKRTDVTA
ncbi:MAG: hypothetical protein ACLR56_08185 [Oscillospiraceae bacterium]